MELALLQRRLFDLFGFGKVMAARKVLNLLVEVVVLGRSWRYSSSVCRSFRFSSSKSVGISASFREGSSNAYRITVIPAR